MKNLLFVVLKSPFIAEAVGCINKLSGNANKAVLLFEDGIYHAVHTEKRKRLLDNNIKIFAIKDDLSARGYNDFQKEGVEVVDYGGAVDLIMEKYESVITI
jgi:sulfur relay protein TusB/DsrH